MGNGSFKEDVKQHYKGCFEKNGQPIESGASIGFNLCCVLPCSTVYSIFIIPANNVRSDIGQMSLATLGLLCSIIPVCATFLITVIPGCIGAGIGFLVK